MCEANLSKSSKDLKVCCNCRWLRSSWVFFVGQVLYKQEHVSVGSDSHGSEVKAAPYLFGVKLEDTISDLGTSRSEHFSDQCLRFSALAVRGTSDEKGTPTMLLKLSASLPQDRFANTTVYCQSMSRAGTARTSNSFPKEVAAIMPRLKLPELLRSVLNHDVISMVCVANSLASDVGDAEAD